jgi:ornithine cyclodeaminase
MSATLPAIKFLYLSEPDMIRAGVTDMPACVDAMEETFALLYTGDYRMAGQNSDSHGAMVTFPEESPFPTMPKPTADRRLMAMPAYLGGSFQTAGCKWYGSNTENRKKGLPRSILTFILNDADTGAPLAIMSANLLSAYRTGAVSGVGARYFARTDARVMGIVGPGVMARTALAACIAARPSIDTVKVKGRGAQSLATFINWVTAEYPQVTTVTVVDTEEEAVRGSDIVSYCTSAETGDVSTYPLVKREWVKVGAFLTMPAAIRLDEALEASDVVKILDNTGLYEAWAVEYPYPTHATIPLVGCRFIDLIHEGVLHADDVLDLGAVVVGDQPGRQNDEQIAILSVGGMPVEDVAWGTMVYRRALAEGIGVELPLWDTPELS